VYSGTGVSFFSFTQKKARWFPAQARGGQTRLQNKTWQRLAASGGKPASPAGSVTQHPPSPLDSQVRSAVTRPEHRDSIAMPAFWTGSLRAARDWTRCKDTPAS